MRNVILKHGKKVDNFILQNIFKKGLVCAFLFVVFVSINIGVASEWRKIDKDDNSDIIRNIEYEKLYNSVAEGTSTTKTFLLKDDLIDDKYNIKGTAEASNWYSSHVIGLINLGKKSDNTKLQWRIVGNDTEKDNKYDLILQATEPITYAPYNATTDAKTFNGETVWASHYGASDVRALLNDMTSDSNTTYFTSGEKTIMNTTTIGTTNSNTGVKYYLKDKLYLPGGGNGGTKIVVGKDNDIDVDGGYFDQFDSWTRSDNGHSTQVAYAHYWNDGNDHTIVALEDVTKPLGVKPFVNVDLSSMYFASTVEAATADVQTKRGITSNTVFNLHFNGGKLLRESKIEYNSTEVTYRGKAGQAVVVQGEDSTKGHWYYSKYISSDMTADASITLEEIKTELSLGTDANLEDCNIWIEQQGDDGLIYARLASVEINQIIYEGIRESNRTGFKYSNGTQITDEELDKLGIRARIESNEHIITMDGFRVHSSGSDPFHILDSKNGGVMDSVIIDLIGNNSIESKGGSAIWSRAAVTFTGTGNLTVTGTLGTWARGIAVDKTLTFNHTGTITTYGWEGIRTPEGSVDIIVNSGTVTTIGPKGTSCRNLIINGGDVKGYALSGNSTDTLYAQTGIVINGGKVYAKTDSRGLNSSSVVINDGEVEIYEDGTDVKGISATSLTIGDTNQTKNPIVNISGNLGGNASGYQYHASGINTSSFTMNSGDLDIDLKNKNTSGYISGIYISGSVVDIRGGNVDIKMNENSRNNSFNSDGIHMGGGSFNVTGGQLGVINDGKGSAISVSTINISDGVANASVFGSDSSGIYSSNSINITGGEVNVAAHTNVNNGIHCNGTINIGKEDDNVDDTTITINRDNVSGSEDNSYGIHASSNINVYEGNITVGTVQTPGFHFGMHIGGTLNVYNGDIISHGYKIGINTTNMDMQGGYVYAKTTSDGSIRMDRRSIVVTNSFEMSDGHVDVELEGQRGVGLMVEGTLGTTHITGGRIEAEVSGIYTKGMRILGKLKIGTLGTEGPTIIINGDIQNEQESWGINYDESGIYAEKNIEINSGNIKIDMKNSKVRNIDTNRFNDLSNPANNYIAAIMTKNSTDAGIVINGGTIDLNVDVEQPDGSYSAGDGMFTYGHITINGGRITSTTNGGVYWVGTKLYHSSGINAKTDLTITGGEVRATNTNTSYKYNGELIGMGLYSDADIILDGGHIVARGIAQALYVDENHSITSSTTGEENAEAGVITKFGSVNYEGTPLIEYDTSEGSNYKNEDYKYVEIGVRHPYYLRYDVEDNIIYKGPAVANGDGTFSDVHFGTGANDSKNILATMGFTFYEEGEGEDKTKVLKLKNAMFESYTKYGLYIEGDAIIELEKNSYSRIIADRVDIESDSESDGTEIISAQEEITDRYGIYSMGNITFRGEGELSVGGQTSAIVSKLSTESAVAIKLSSAKEAGTDYDVVALEGSKESTLGVDVKPYPDVTTTEDWNFYKYVRIGSLPVYYFKYDAANNKMYKMVGDSGTVIDKNEVIYGWDIADNVLTLNNFEFRTSANCALEVVGAGTINIRNNCSITTQYISSGDNYGIKSNSSLTLMGTGKLGLQSGMSGSQGYIGIHCADDMSITGGKHYIYGQKYGIYVGGDNFTVNNTTVEATASSTSETSGAIHLNNGTTCDVYECVKVADNVAGTGAKTITDYEDEYATYNTKKYIKMEPAVVSVTITWGDMAFVGENVWEPESHTYKSVIKPSVAGSSDLIKIYNDENAGSNVPVKASVNVNINNLTNTYGIVGTLDNGSTSKDNEIIDVGRDLTSKLTLNTTQLLVEGTSGNVGTVSVTLEDYRKE